MSKSAPVTRELKLRRKRAAWRQGKRKKASEKKRGWLRLYPMGEWRRGRKVQRWVEMMVN